MKLENRTANDKTIDPVSRAKAHGPAFDPIRTVPDYHSAGSEREPDGWPVFVVKHDGVIIEANPQAEEAFHELPSIIGGPGGWQVRSDWNQWLWGRACSHTDSPRAEAVDLEVDYRWVIIRRRDARPQAVIEVHLPCLEDLGSEIDPVWRQILSMIRQGDRF